MTDPAATETPALSGAPSSSRWLLATLVLLALAGLLSSLLLWQKLSAIQEVLAHQSAESGAQAAQAQGVAKQAQELSMDSAAKLAMMEARLSEVALQRSQLEELMQSLSRTRDENLAVDIESSLRLAQQQAQLTGSVEPLLAALKSADQRVTRAAQPRLVPLQRAIARDILHVKATTLADTPALLVKLDELVQLADELPLANGVASVPRGEQTLQRKPDESVRGWWMRLVAMVGDEARNLVRVSRIEHPEAALLSPEQSFFLRENFKLKLLNARLGLLSRQTDSVRTDLAAASQALGRYFEASSRRTLAAQTLLLQVQSQLKALELPRVDDTLAAVATAAAGR